MLIIRTNRLLSGVGGNISDGGRPASAHVRGLGLKDGEQSTGIGQAEGSICNSDLPHASIRCCSFNGVSMLGENVRYDTCKIEFIVGVGHVDGDESGNVERSCHWPELKAQGSVKRILASGSNFSNIWVGIPKTKKGGYVIVWPCW